MEKQDQGSKLSRIEKKSKKDAIEGLKLELLNLVVGPPLEDTKKPKKSIIHSKPSTSERPPWRLFQFDSFIPVRLEQLHKSQALQDLFELRTIW
ncbi:hypothetical protein QL285_017301 [Trifolium repens]|nr:hypothetical protein QL285_017301 [Trifolium repens]